MLADYTWSELGAIFAIGWTLAHASSLAGTLRVSGVLPNSDLLLHLPAAGCAARYSAGDTLAGGYGTGWRADHHGHAQWL